MKILEKLALAKEMITHDWLFVRLSFFKENCKTIAIDLSKQQAIDADPRAIQQINFTAILNRAGNTAMFIQIIANVL